MARKPAKPSRSSKTPAKAIKTAVRNTAVPRAGIAPSTRQPAASRPAAKPASGIKKQPTREQIAQRAYDIWRSGTGGSEMDNWLRAERELRG